MISTALAGNLNKMVTVIVRMDTSRIERVVNFAFFSIFLLEIMLNPPFLKAVSYIVVLIIPIVI
jgi:hypothetical protein